MDKPENVELEELFCLVVRELDLSGQARRRLGLSNVEVNVGAFNHDAQAFLLFVDVTTPDGKNWMGSAEILKLEINLNRSPDKLTNLVKTRWLAAVQSLKDLLDREYGPDEPVVAH